MKNKLVTIWSFIRDYKRHSIFFSYFKSMLAIIFIFLIILGVVMFNINDYAVKNDLKLLCYQVIAKTTSIFDLVNYQISRNYYIIQTNTNIQRFLSLERNTVGINENRWLISDIVNQLFYTSVQNKYTGSIYLYSFKNKYLLSSNGSRPIEEFFDIDWLNHYSEYKTDMVYTRRKYYQSSHDDTISFIYQIYSGDSLTGLLVYNIKYDVFASMILGNDTAGSNIYILDNLGNVFYSQHSDLINQSINQKPDLANVLQLAKNNWPISQVSRNEIITITKNVSSQYYVILATNTTEIINTRNNLIIIIFYGIISGIIVSFVLSAIISIYLYNHIINLMLMFQSPFDKVKGLEKIRLSKEELFISQNISRLLNWNKQIQQDLISKLSELKRAQCVAMQMQINPHFLFNSLQLVNLSIIKESKRDTIASQIVSILSDMLRYTINNEEYITDFIQEIDQAHKYIEIENLRSKNMFICTWNIEENVLAYKTIKFVLQPILENSIVHGFYKCEKLLKTINITAYAKDGILYIEITDNGNGIAAERLAEIEQKLKNNSIYINNHIGLDNVNTRINLLYGQEYGIRIKSSHMQGTIVIISMPIIQ